MLTDVVSSTALWDAEPEKMEVALEQHDRLVRRVIERAGGELISSRGEGDSTFSVFGDPVAAVHAARSVVVGMEEASWPTTTALSVRIGLHTGAAQQRAGNWFGAAINLAARLRTLAEPGCVLLSEATAGRVRGELPADHQLNFLGERHVRGIRAPVRIWTVTNRGAPLPRLPQTVDTNVVAPVHALLGRHDEVVVVEKLLGHHRLVTIVGPGGGGKTRLATEVAVRGRGEYLDGVWLVDLSSIDDPDATLATVLSTLSTGSLAALRDRRMLVVLDNCEHVVVQAGEAASQLLEISPGTRVLATSRLPLGMSAEAVMPIPPLGIGGAGDDVAGLIDSPSYRLFLQRAQAADASFTVDEGDLRAIARLLSALDGIPLAIEIAASHVRTTSLDRLADAAERDVTHLPTLQRDASERHRSVATAIEWSVQLLSPTDRVAFDALSVCRGFDLDLAAAVTGRSDVADCVATLVDASLVDISKSGRSRMLEPVRQHAQDRLIYSGAFEVCTDRHAVQVLATVRTLVRGAYTDPAARRRLRAETGNIELALSTFLDRGRIAEALQLFGSIGVFWHTVDQAMLRRWYERVVALLGDVPASDAARARLAIGMLRQGTGEREAIPLLEAARDGFLSSHRIAGAAMAALWLAREMAIDETDDDAAWAAFEQADALAEQAGDELLRIWCLVWFGLLATRRGALDDATSFLHDAVEASVHCGQHHALGAALGALADIGTARGGQTSARRLLDRAVATCRETDDDWQLASQLRRRAFNCATGNDLGQAVADISECADIDLRIDEERPIADLLAIAAVAADALGMAEAAAIARRSLGQWMILRDQPSDVFIDAALGLPLADDLRPIVGDIPDDPALRTTLRDVVDALAGVTA